MNAKITVVYDEGALMDTDLIGAQGSSFAIEMDGELTLFGVGRRSRYLVHNMYDLDFENENLTRVIIADKNADEWGGIGGVFKDREEPLPIMAPSSVWGEKTMFGSTGMFIPADYVEKAERKDLTPGWNQISEHLFVGVFGNDRFQEAVLVIRALNGPVVVSSRCMSGMKSIFEAVEDRFKMMPVAFIGAIDIGKRKNDALCDAVAGYLKEIGCKDLRFNHCTGELGIGRLRTVLGLEGVKDFYVGESVEYKL